MITRRRETQTAPEPPVRLYKVIALSFLFLTVVLLGVVIFITSKKVEIVVVAKEDAERIQLNVPVSPQGGGNAIKGAVSSTVFSWSEKYHPTGNKKEDGIATGEVIIYNTETSNQPLVKTTRLITSSGALFRLSEGANVPAKGQVVVSVYADKPGASGDIAPSKFTIPGLAEAKQSIVYAESKQPMTGGIRTVGVLSEADLGNAATDYKEKVKAAYLASLPVNPSQETLVTVANQTFKADKKVGDEVSEFTLSGKWTLVTVSYNKQELENAASLELVNKLDGLSEKFLSTSKQPQVSVAAHNLQSGTAELAVAQEATITLDANAPKLLPQNFLGKKKDEIERYVLGLEHVAGVEVKFSPSWMKSAPTVPDRVKVVVKNVR